MRNMQTIIEKSRSGLEQKIFLLDQPIDASDLRSEETVPEDKSVLFEQHKQRYSKFIKYPDWEEIVEKTEQRLIL